VRYQYITAVAQTAGRQNKGQEVRIEVTLNHYIHSVTLLIRHLKVYTRRLLPINRVPSSHQPHIRSYIRTRMDLFLACGLLGVLLEDVGGVGGEAGLLVV
jgi:hypothetical protein